MFDKLLEWDQNTLIQMNVLGSETFDPFWLTVTKFPPWIPFFLLIVFLLFRVYGYKQTFWILLSFAAMLIVVTTAIFMSKTGIGRLRPVNDPSINQFLRTLIKPSDYSFFSGHAASSFSITTLAVLYLKRIKWIYLIFLWPLLFSFSRLYLGVHYPLDILVGTLVGILCAFIFYRLHQRIKAPYIP